VSHRRRALLLGGLALVLGGLAASNVAGREAALARRVGGLVDVVVAREPIAAGALVREHALAIRRVPRRFAPQGAVSSAGTLVNLRAAVDIAPGSDILASMVADGRAPPAGPAIRRGERVAHVVALAAPDLITPGSHVDVLVTPEPREGARGEAMLALEDVEVVGASRAPEGGGSGSDSGLPRVALDLRVSVRQAVYLAAAGAFAREIRLLARAPGDRGRLGAVSAAG
jgi:pilus assembly protein CpaB